jgi:ferredoxin
MENESYIRPRMVPNPVTPCKAIHINSSLCTGCMRCVEVCRIDVLVPGGEKGKPPVALYPDERNLSMKMRHFHKIFSVPLHRSSTMVC